MDCEEGRLHGTHTLFALASTMTRCVWSPPLLCPLPDSLAINSTRIEFERRIDSRASISFMSWQGQMLALGLRRASPL